MGRLIIFTTKENLQQISTAKVWVVDGTFKTGSPVFMQVYAVHSWLNIAVVPLVYPPLPNKTMNRYAWLFRIM